MCEKIDVLNRDNFVYRLKDLVSILAEKKQGCCFAIDGAWGSGKTFVLEWFESIIKDEQLEETADNKYFVFHYDCWKYDYYEESAIAIVAAMLDATDKELSIFPEDVENGVKIAWKTTKRTLGKIAGEFCKNKIGIDLVEIASDAAEAQGEADENDFDSLYGFKRALEEARAGIREIAADKTVVIVVDELDRCAPTYSIKVLERLHHIFNDLQNVIVIVSMDKKQLEHSIKEIYGDIDVDIYLRKFISFKVTLDNGIATNYLDKYKSYTSMFEIEDAQKTMIEEFFGNIMLDLDMRTQERIFRKAEIVHELIKYNNYTDCSIMTFEILYLTVSLKQSSKGLEWLSRIWGAHFGDLERKLGKKYYNILNEYGKNVRINQRSENVWNLDATLIGKTFFWLANLYYKYNNGICGHYSYYVQDEDYIELVHRFADLINIIDID
ncbi:MAG: hypothetical protein IJW18_08100 [Lachnospiraceae bacterium]|nr:hypothetical protein [Lachnospiraceae bacterium]